MGNLMLNGISYGGSNIYPDAIAEEYDSTQTYTAGDYVMHGGKLYRCNHIGATGTWEPTWWDETSATDYTKSVNTALTTQINNIHDDTADAYSASSTYAVGDLCIAFGRLYRCTTAISTPEAWNSSHWAATTIADEIAAKANASDVGAYIAYGYTDETTLPANTVVVCSVAFDVPVGYEVIAVWDDSYFAGLVATPIRIGLRNATTGKVTATINYLSPQGITSSRKYLVRAVCMKKVTRQT